MCCGSGKVVSRRSSLSNAPVGGAITAPMMWRLLSGIRRLLHDEGLTIRGVQKILREQGVRHVAGLIEAEADTVDITVEATEVAETVEIRPRVVEMADWSDAAKAKSNAATEAADAPDLSQRRPSPR